MTTTFKQKLFLMFNKKKAVCIIIIKDTRKLQVEYVIPNEANQITVDKHIRNITKDGYTFLKGIPTYFYKQNDPQPLPVNDKNNPAMTIEEYTAAIHSKAVKDIFNAFEDGMTVSTLIKIGIGISVGAIAGVGYYLFTQFAPVMDRLQQIIEMLEVIGGGQ